MLPNRRIITGEWRSPWLLATALVAAGCGGDDEGRPNPTPEDMLLNASLENCALEAAIAATDLSLVKSGDFDRTQAAGWQASVDSSPSPPTAPRPIKGYCPEDSSYDCCIPNDDALWNTPPSNLTPAQQLQVAEEKRLQQGSPGQPGYRCAPPEAEYCPGLGVQQTLTTQAPMVPIACKAEQTPGKALHIRAARYTDWGAQLFLPFAAPGFDASSYDGISFWVRIGEGGTQPVGHDLFIGFDDMFTKESQPKYQWEIDAYGDYVRVPNSNGDLVPVPVIDPETGLQKPLYLQSPPSAGEPKQASNCYDVGVDALKCDRFGSGIGLEQEWRFVKIPFASMRQRGYGVPSPAGRVLREALLSFDIYMDVGNWDFWIDQVAFYRDAPQAVAP